jgi:hypothetical protein
MLTIKVIHNNDTKFILDIVKEFKSRAYIEPYNSNVSRLKGKIYKMQEAFGSRKVPLIVFEDENMEELGAIWSESNPDWKLEIKTMLNKLEE